MKSPRTKRRLLTAGVGVAAFTAAPGLACGNPVSPRYEQRPELTPATEPAVAPTAAPTTAPTPTAAVAADPPPEQEP